MLFHLEKKGFYQDAENTPDWFPQDIAFRAPTHKHGMTATEYNKLLRNVR